MCSFEQLFYRKKSLAAPVRTFGVPDEEILVRFPLLGTIEHMKNSPRRRRVGHYNCRAGLASWLAVIQLTCVANILKNIGEPLYGPGVLKYLFCFQVCLKIFPYRIFGRKRYDRSV